MENINSFQEIIKECFDLYKEKNKKYGNSYSKTYKEYGKSVLILRLDDKLSRLKQIILNGETETSDESVRDTLIDMANYSIMAVMELQNEKK